MIQDVPETSSEERMHVLDETCWCKHTPLARLHNLISTANAQLQDLF